MIEVVHTLGLGWWGGDGCCVGDGIIVFGCFVDIKEGLAGRELALCGPWQLAHLRVVWEQDLPVVWQVGQTWWRVF